MLEVAIIGKSYVKKDGVQRLRAYLIVTEDGQSKLVSKEMLIQCVREGSIKVVNMTLSSDGRFIGSTRVYPNMFGKDRRAQENVQPAQQAPVQKPVQKAPVQKPARNEQAPTQGVVQKPVQQVQDSPVTRRNTENDIICTELYTCGKKIVGMKCNMGSKEGVLIGGVEAINYFTGDGGKGKVNNVKFSGKSLKLEPPAKKKPFKDVLKKFIAASEGVDWSVEVFNSKTKEYTISFSGPNVSDEEKRASKKLIAGYAMILAGNKITDARSFKDYENNTSRDEIVVEAVDGINGVRKALKDVLK